jgi:hypothetical protein
MGLGFLCRCLYYMQIVIFLSYLEYIQNFTKYVCYYRILLKWILTCLIQSPLRLQKYYNYRHMYYITSQRTESLPLSSYENLLLFLVFWEPFTYTSENIKSIFCILVSYHLTILRVCCYIVLLTFYNEWILNFSYFSIWDPY